MLTQISRLTATLGVALCATAALAQGSVDDAVSSRVLPGWQQEDGTRMAALEMTLAPGWKTYWRSPGDVGIPPHFEWNRPRNVANVVVHWPTPSVFWEQGMRSVGYKEKVVLPMTITPRKAGREMRLSGEVHIGICSDICVPATLEIDTVLPADPGTRSAGIVASLASLPFSGTEAGVSSVDCRLFPLEDGLGLEARITMPSAGGHENVVVETEDPSIWVSEPETTRSGNALTLEARMLKADGGPMVVDRSALRFTVIGSSYGVDIHGCTG